MIYKTLRFIFMIHWAYFVFTLLDILICKRFISGHLKWRKKAEVVNSLRESLMSNQIEAILLWSYYCTLVLNWSHYCAVILLLDLSLTIVPWSGSTGKQSLPTPESHPRQPESPTNRQKSSCTVLILLIPAKMAELHKEWDWHIFQFTNLWERERALLRHF